MVTVQTTSINQPSFILVFSLTAFMVSEIGFYIFIMLWRSHNFKTMYIDCHRLYYTDFLTHLKMWLIVTHIFYYSTIDTPQKNNKTNKKLSAEFSELSESQGVLSHRSFYNHFFVINFRMAILIYYSPLRFRNLTFLNWCCVYNKCEAMKSVIMVAHCST